MDIRHEPTDTLLWGKRLEKQPVSGLTIVCLTQCDKSPPHRADELADYGLWDVGPLLQSWWTPAGIGTRRFESIPKHARRVTCLKYTGHRVRGDGVACAHEHGL